MEVVEEAVFDLELREEPRSLRLFALADLGDRDALNVEVHLLGLRGHREDRPEVEGVCVPDAANGRGITEPDGDVHVLRAALGLERLSDHTERPCLWAQDVVVVWEAVVLCVLAGLALRGRPLHAPLREENHRLEPPLQKVLAAPHGGLQVPVLAVAHKDVLAHFGGPAERKHDKRPPDHPQHPAVCAADAAKEVGDDEAVRVCLVVRCYTKKAFGGNGVASGHDPYAA
mmetsp:Transcript_42263/g.84706  ORF Transcript_42263/g.84706 Transcript_42263/m.84706 type:complete len:229 (-) Transcript_42263:338-1024(-)